MNVRGKRWLVLGDMRELGAGEVAEHEDVGRWMRFGDWQGLVTVGRLGLSLADGAVEAGMEAGRVMRCDAPEAAADHLLAELKPGDAVLFKASRGVHLEVAVERILAELNNRG
jgi:UDP-N-acetylmuramoyl-tripeptide--D-alanyl-D-alanine ligase